LAFFSSWNYVGIDITNAAMKIQCHSKSEELCPFCASNLHQTMQTMQTVGTVQYRSIFDNQLDIQ